MEPANDPNVSAALSNAPAAPVAPEHTPEPVQDLPGEPGQPTAEPIAQPTEPIVEPAAEPTNEPAPELPEADPVPEPTQEPAPANPEYIPESYNSFMEAANKVLTDKGINTDALARAVEAADGVVTDEVRAILVDKLGSAEATVMISGFETEYKAASSAISAEANKVYEIVGGKDEWNKMAEWTKTPEAGLSPEAKDAYNDMLRQGGVQAALAAQAIKEAYMQSPGFTQDPNLMQPDSNANPAVAVDAISRSEYVTEKGKAMRSNDGVAVAKLEERARYTRENHLDQWYGTRLNG